MFYIFLTYYYFVIETKRFYFNKYFKNIYYVRPTYF